MTSSAARSIEANSQARSRAGHRDLRPLPAAVLLLPLMPVALFPPAVAISAALKGWISIPLDSRLWYVSFCWLTLAILALIARSRGVSIRALGWQAPIGADWLWATIGCAIGIFIVYPIAAFTNRLLGTPMLTRLQTPQLTGGALTIQFLYAAVTAPIAEETLFRGLGIGYLSARGFAPAIAALISMFAFALYHVPGFGSGGAIFIFLWSAIPSWLFLKRGNLAPGWLMHVMNNTLVYLVMPLLR